MKKGILIVMLLFLMFPMQVKGACTDSEVVSLSKMANNVTFTPVFDESTGNFNLIISNLHPNFYFLDVLQNQTYNYNGTELVLYNFTPSKSYRFKFYSALPACTGNSILSKYVTLPGYNPYYKDPICKGFETYSFCQKWNTYNYSYDKVVELTNKYRNENEGTEDQTKEKVMGFYDYVLLYYSKYYYIILPVIIIICIIAIVRKKKKDEFF